MKKAFFYVIALNSEQPNDCCKKIVWERNDYGGICSSYLSLTKCENYLRTHFF